MWGKETRVSGAVARPAQKVVKSSHLCKHRLSPPAFQELTINNMNNTSNIKETLAQASLMFTVLSSTAKHNPQFSMGYSEKELSQMSDEIMKYVRELYKSNS